MQPPEFTPMKTYLLTLLYFAAGSLVNAEDNNTNKNEDMNTYKKTVTLWYEAFTKKDPVLLEQILHEDWVDIPGAPGTPPGPAGVKPLLAQLTTTFPDLKLTIEEILQDGKKVVVRARMAGTQSEPFLGFRLRTAKWTFRLSTYTNSRTGELFGRGTPRIG